MKLIFERGAPGRGCDLVPPCTLPVSYTHLTLPTN